MTAGTAARPAGYHHELGFHGSDDELLGLAVPFIEDGVADGEPTLVSLDDHASRLVRSAVGDDAGITYLRVTEQYSRPAATIRSYRTLLAGLVGAGARQVRAVGAVPHPGVGAPWDTWARYEAVVNHAYDDFPLWGLCLYDTRITPDRVLADVERTHPHIATTDGRRRPNPRYQEPSAFLDSRWVSPPDPLEAGAPAAELVEPSPRAARRAVTAVAERSLVAPRAVGDLVVATSEVVTNGLLHGRPPVVLRAWTARDRVVVSVTDRGRGPVDPFVGLLPAQDGRGPGGFGLWLVHQLCTDVTLASTDEGFTVRLVAGEPYLAT